jgi:thioredoxin reductase
VTLSYRSAAFNRAKQKNREKVEAAAAAGTLRVLFSSNVKEIHSDSVDIAVDDKVEKLKNDFVIVSAGGILPTAFLKTIGINVETKFGTE